MTQTIQKTLRDSAGMRWTALLLLALAMFCSYIFMDIFNVSEVTDTTAVFTAEAGNGKEIIINYLLGKDYMLHMKMQVNGMAGLFPPNTSTMDVNWKELCPQQERHSFPVGNRKNAKNCQHNRRTDNRIRKTSKQHIPPYKQQDKALADNS